MEKAVLRFLPLSAIKFNGKYCKTAQMLNIIFGNNFALTFNSTMEQNAAFCIDFCDVGGD